MKHYRHFLSRSYSAFTLIELLIVVAIIAILAAIAVPNFLEAQTRAKVSRARADMRTEATGLETYRIDWNKYPRQVEAFVQTPTYYHGATPEWHEHVPSIMTTPIAYLNSIPTDPFLPKVAEHRANQIKYIEGRHFMWNAHYSISCHPHLANTFFKIPREQAGEWGLFSYGPDRKYYNQPDGRNPKTMGQWMDYDSTNGTISLGNIIRTQKNGENFGVVTDAAFWY
jgi:type II secretion system protein G